MKKILFPLISTLGLMVCQSVNAQQTPSSNSLEINTNISPKKGCLLSKIKNTPIQQSQTSDNSTFGKIYGVVGDIVMLELDDGTTKHMSVKRSKVGHMHSLIGSRVVCHTSNT